MKIKNGKTRSRRAARKARSFLRFPPSDFPHCFGFSPRFAPVAAGRISDFGFTVSRRSTLPTLQHSHAPTLPRSARAFTMVEIALCIAIIGFALVAIIGVLPAAMRVQQDNRSDTLIDQDGNYFMEAIRHGAQGLDDLSIYVYEINFVKFNPTTQLFQTNSATDYVAPNSLYT